MVGMSQRTRLTPEQRREQLLDLGIRLFANHSLDEISIDVVAREAGISRGLLYHYFGDKMAFREAVVRRAADALVAQTAPPETGEPVERLLASMTAVLKAKRSRTSASSATFLVYSQISCWGE